MAAPFMQLKVPSLPFSLNAKHLLSAVILFALLCSIAYTTSHLYLIDRDASLTTIPLNLPPPSFGDLDEQLALTFLPERLPCDAIMAERYAGLRGHPTLFALILHQSEGVLPTLMHALVETMTFLGGNTTHLSLYESQSRDKTQPMLKVFQEYLQRTVKLASLNVVTDGDHESWDVWNRIALLAEYRNRALQPLYKQLIQPAPKTVLFLNDIYICPNQILELLHQHVSQSADASCGIDWSDNENFYDSWVAKDITGDAIISIAETEFHQRMNIFENHAPSREKYERGENVQVYACWNGMIAMSPEPFIGKGKVRFRRGRLDGECPASEAQIIAKDFWTWGYRKWQIIPSVNMGYRLEDTVRELKLERSRRLWDGKMQWVDTMPEKVRCNPQPELGVEGSIWDKTLWVPPVDPVKRRKRQA